MRLTTRTRYGMRLMIDLALHEGEGKGRTLKEIAEEEEISEKYLSQIVIPLRRAGLLSAVQGSHRGYSLTRRAKDISATEVVVAIEGTLSPVDFAPHNDAAQKPAERASMTLWRKLEVAMENTLNAISLEDLAQDARLELESNDFVI